MLTGGDRGSTLIGGGRGRILTVGGPARVRYAMAVDGGRRKEVAVGESNNGEATAAVGNVAGNGRWRATGK